MRRIFKEKFLNKNNKASSNSLTDKTLFYFLLPSMIIVIIVLLGPLIYTLYLSFTKWVFTIPGSENQFAGFSNYISIFKNIKFWKSVNVSIVFALVSVLTEIVLGTFLAKLLNSKFLGRGLFRSIMIIPMVIPAAIVGLFWQLLYAPNGVLNFFLETLGLTSVSWLGINMALWSLVIVDVWQFTPFVIIIILAGLQLVENSTIEAAKVDGADNIELFFFIELPVIIPYLFLVFFMRLMDALRDFDKTYILTQGGPGTATWLLSLHTYEYGFKFMRIGDAAAISIVFILLVIVIYFPILNFMRKINR